MNEGIIHKYETDLLPIYRLYTIKLNTLIEDLLNKFNIGFAQIEYRTKKSDSLKEKLNRKDYADPLNEITDFSGIRIITYYQDDIKKVSDLISKEFVIRDKDSIDASSLLDVDEFGYKSLHLVINLNEQRKVLSEWNIFAPFCCEVQIRTVLQHAWASISHKLDYKKSSQVPSELRRQLFRLSALLELADEEFLSIRDDKKHILQQYKEEVTLGDLDIPLNSNSLEEYIEQKVDLNSWYQIGLGAGMETFQGAINHKQGYMDVLLLTLQTIGIKTISEFANLLPALNEKSKELLPRYVKELNTIGGVFYSIPIDILTILISLVEIKKIPEHYDWGGEILNEPIRTILKQFRRNAFKD